jgi:hypothetical protein
MRVANGLRGTLAAAMLVLILVVLPGLARAQGGYGLAWWTVDGGDGVIADSGGRYTLQSTVGQPDASSALIGGSYALTGGFWFGQGPPGHRLYLPVILRAG